MLDGRARIGPLGETSFTDGLQPEVVRGSGARAEASADFHLALSQARSGGDASGVEWRGHVPRTGEDAAPAAAVLDDLMADLAGRAIADPTGLAATLLTAFGDRATGDAGAALLRGLAAAGAPGAAAGLSIEIRAVGDAVLPPGARGAYLPAEPGAGGARGSILIHRDLIGDPGTLRMVVAEELGHHLDARLGAGDARGDEGTIFARILAGEALAPAVLTRLRAEDDHGRLLTGQSVEFYEPESATSGTATSSSSSQSSSSPSGPGPGEGSMDAAASHSQSGGSSQPSSASSPGPGEGSMDAAASHSQSSGFSGSTSGSDDAPASAGRSADTFHDRTDWSSDDGDDDDGWRSSAPPQGGSSDLRAPPSSGDGPRETGPPATDRANASFGWEGLDPSAAISLMGGWVEMNPGLGRTAPEAEAAEVEAARQAAQAAIGRMELERFQRQARAGAGSIAAEPHGPAGSAPSAGSIVEGLARRAIGLGRIANPVGAFVAGLGIKPLGDGTMPVEPPEGRDAAGSGALGPDHTGALPVDTSVLGRPTSTPIPPLQGPQSTGGLDVPPELPETVGTPVPEIDPLDGVVTMGHERTPEEYEDLARDPARGGVITDGSVREREVGIGAEADGILPGPIVRERTGAAEFTDRARQDWDVKSFRSDYPAAIGGFDLETDMANVEKKLQSGYNVIVDTGALTEADAGALRAEVERRSLGDRVVFWP